MKETKVGDNASGLPLSVVEKQNKRAVSARTEVTLILGACLAHGGYVEEPFDVGLAPQTASTFS